MRRALPVLLFLSAITASAQPTWRFHLAFENGDGARDTIWLVFDTTATAMPLVDVALGEGSVAMDPGAFNVWTYNGVGDSTKTKAQPYSDFPELSTQISGFNWQAPVTIRWDSSLFHAPYLPGPESIGLASMESTHFFFYNNDPWLQAFNMMLDDSVVIADPDEVDVLFPIYAGVSAYSTAGLIRPPMTSFVSTWPDPVGDGPLYIRSELPCEIRLFDPLGQPVLRPIACNGLCEIDLQFLKAGSYLLHVVDSNNSICYAKIIK